MDEFRTANVRGSAALYAAEALRKEAARLHKQREKLSPRSHLRHRALTRKINDLDGVARELARIADEHVADFVARVQASVTS